MTPPRLLALLLLAVPALPQDYPFLKTTPGTLGATLDFAYSGAPPATSILFMVAATNGPLPLSLISPGDPRSLSVDPNAASLWFATGTGAGTGGWSLPVPNNPFLHGAQLWFQTCTLPGSPFLVDKISNPCRAQLGSSGQSALLPVQLAVARSFGTVIVNQLLGIGGGSVLYAGGGQGSILSAKGLDSTEVYDVATMAAAPGPKLTRSRALGAGVRLRDGRVLFAGGVDDFLNPLASCELYDPATNAFVATGSMSIPRAAHAGAVLPDGRVMVVGGTKSFSNPILALADTEDSVEIWDPATGAWSAAAPMNARRLAPSLDVLIDQTVMVSGGFEIQSIFGIPLPIGSVRTTELWDAARNQWSAGPSMISSRGVHLLNTVQLKDGRLLVTGGAQSGPLLTNAAPIDDCEVYDFAAKVWVPLPKMPNARALHTATVLANGKVIVAGGAMGTLLSPVAIDKVDELDPWTGTWRSLGNLVTTRAAHGAALTPEGLVVLIGGQGGAQGLSLDSVETIHP